MSYPRFQRSRDFKFFTRTAGNLTLNSNGVWANLPTIGTTWDATLAAEAGDVLEATLCGLMDGAVVYNWFDVHTIVSAAAVNSFGSQTAVANSDHGVGAWYCETGLTVPIAGSVFYVLVAGDISAGTVTARLRYQGNAATNRALNATTIYPLQFAVRNLGPKDPN